MATIIGLCHCLFLTTFSRKNHKIQMSLVKVIKLKRHERYFLGDSCALLFFIRMRTQTQSYLRSISAVVSFHAVLGERRIWCCLINIKHNTQFWTTIFWKHFHSDDSPSSCDVNYVEGRRESAVDTRPIKFPWNLWHCFVKDSRSELIFEQLHWP